ncbi:MAG: SUMF1/EgtB/PvdO family nonheme iron enzyme [Lentisphaeria bacterium]|nr:SUMF1/EgtB/PvdO family nonheme iron enzyme [Lentisphaeria bacterium]
MDDSNKTIPPRRQHVSMHHVSDEATIPGQHDRRPDGRFQIGDLIMSRYKVLAELGQGGMGVVYKCFDETAGVEVALKALPPELSHNTQEMDDIKDNFQLISKLIHQNIAASKNLERDPYNGNYYLIMECCEGEDLRRWLKQKRRDGNLTVNDILPIVKQIADALDYAHEMKIIHRDIKPGNIMIDAHGKIKVLDFGLAAQIHTSMTRISMAYHGTSGTGPYMAPEQWEGRAQDAKTDQYALAVMTYEMLTGTPPFESTDAAVLRQAVLNSKVNPIPDIPKYVNTALLRALSKKSTDRFGVCSDFVAALSGKKNNKKGCAGKWLAGILLLVLLMGGGLYCYYTMPVGQIGFLWEKTKRFANSVMARWNAENAAKKAEQERLAKEAAAAEAEQIRTAAEKRRAEEREIAALVQEAYRLQARVAGKKKEIESAGCDRGQTFGKYLDILKNKFESGGQNIASGSVTDAKNDFLEAEQAADWILINAPLRELVQRLQKQVSDLKTNVEKFNGSRLAYMTWYDALSLEKQAFDFYGSGDFKRAELSFKNALAGYKKAYAEARKLTLDDLSLTAERAKNNKQWGRMKEIAEKIRSLDENKADELISFADKQIKLEKLNKELAAAKNAKTEQNWQTVHDHAAAALKIDSGCTEAQQLKQDAEQNLKPTLEIIATVDGERVPAKVKFGNSAELDTMRIFENFTKNGKYNASLSYQSGKTKYEGYFSFTCDWRGPKQQTVALKKSISDDTVITLSNGVLLEMVKIKAGTFMMGSPSSESGRSNDEKQHQVTLSKDYWLGKYEVTQAQWRAIMGNNPSRFKGDNRPVECINWDEAKQFCDKLNERYAGKLPRGYKFDLPTEAQWEYACRAGTTTALNSGEDMRIIGKNNSPNLDLVGWYGGNCGRDFELSNGYDISGWPEKQYSDTRGGTHPVGRKQPNNWGLYDMHGNVYEWCRDWYGDYSDGAVVDPVGPRTGSNRVIRGGGWSIYARYCRSAGRITDSPGDRYYFLGFRLALVPVAAADEKGNTEATEHSRKPTLEIFATVDGERVPAKVKFGTTVLDTMRYLQGFTKNNTYKATVFYQKGDDEYKKEIEFTCNWTGPKKMTVELNKVVKFNGFVDCDGLGLEMVKVEPGTFIMSKKDGQNFSEEIEHQKMLTKTFYIGKYEVTNALWCKVMDTESPPSLRNIGKDYPVDNVSWYDAMKFCEKMNRYAPKGWRFTLPTETQWEYAARGGRKSKEYKYSGGNDPDRVSWYNENSMGTTHPVGEKRPNELGLYDMSGNVYEWCLDNWKNKSNKSLAEFSRPYSDSDDSRRVRKGGGWFGRVEYSRIASRGNNSPDYRNGTLGFRLALVPASAYPESD